MNYPTLHVFLNENKTVALIFRGTNHQIAQVEFGISRHLHQFIVKTTNGALREAAWIAAKRLEDYGTCLSRTVWIEEYPRIAVLEWDAECQTYAFSKDLHGPLSKENNNA